MLIVLFCMLTLSINNEFELIAATEMNCVIDEKGFIQRGFLVSTYTNSTIIFYIGLSDAYTKSLIIKTEKKMANSSFLRCFRLNKYIKCILFVEN